VQKRSQNTRAHLLDAAAQQFSLNGYAATSVDDICRLAGVSKGAFYHHFESKQALFLALLNTWLELIDSGLAGFQQSTVPQTLVAMTDILPGILEAGRDRLPMFLEFWLHASRDPQVWQASIAPYRHFRDYFAGLIAAGVAEGTLKKVNPQIAGQVILSMAVGTLLQALLEPRGADWVKTAQQGMQIIMKGLSR
jgi:AcrR family transcriptional regulator